MDIVFDPTFLFAAGVMLVPVSKCETMNQTMDYLTQPSFIAPFILFFLVRMIVKATAPKGSVLSSTDNMVANWFLCNGVFFNLFLDVVAGQFQSMGEMSVQYLKVEPRYKHGLHHDSGSVVFITSMMELFIQCPLCFLAYFAYHHKKSYRSAIEIIVSVLHFSGVWFFYVPEFLRGFPHIDEDKNYTFSTDYLLYYWFGFWIGGTIWVIVPFLITRRATYAIADRETGKNTPVQKKTQ